MHLGVDCARFVKKPETETACKIRYNNLCIRFGRDAELFMYLIQGIIGSASVPLMKSSASELGLTKDLRCV